MGELSSGDSTRVTPVDQWKGLAPPQQGCLVVIYGSRLGQRYALPEDGQVVIGREPGLDISLHEDAVSRRHALIRCDEGGKTLEDQGSTNGTYLNDRTITQVLLTHGDLIKIGGTIFKFLDSGNVESAYYEEIYRMFIVDGLTEAYNRRYLLETMERDISRARRYNRPLALIMLDLDHFKRVNDTYGHLTGDYVLRELAAIIRRRVRREEVFARYGGEEFVILLPETGLQAALLYAELLRGLVEEHTFFFEGKSMKVTISLGAAELTPEMKSPLQLLAIADKNLYAAKSAGRNRCVG